MCFSRRKRKVNDSNKDIPFKCEGSVIKYYSYVDPIESSEKKKKDVKDERSNLVHQNPYSQIDKRTASVIDIEMLRTTSMVSSSQPLIQHANKTSDELKIVKEIEEEKNFKPIKNNTLKNIEIIKTSTQNSEILKLETTLGNRETPRVNQFYNDSRKFPLQISESRLSESVKNQKIIVEAVPELLNLEPYGYFIDIKRHKSIPKHVDYSKVSPTCEIPKNIPVISTNPEKSKSTGIRNVNEREILNEMYEEPKPPSSDLFIHSSKNLTNSEEMESKHRRSLTEGDTFKVGDLQNFKKNYLKDKTGQIDIGNDILYRFHLPLSLHNIL